MGPAFGPDQCWAVFTGWPGSQAGSHIENQLFSFWVKTGLKTNFKVLTHVRTDYENQNQKLKKKEKENQMGLHMKT